ncbi:hypothetical protein BDV93DRAFT_559585, partial [Ceratobasidium sp. AG-I]
MFDYFVISFTVFLVTGFMTGTSLAPIWPGYPILCTSGFFTLGISLFLVDKFETLYECYENLHRLNPSKFNNCGTFYNQAITVTVLEQLIENFQMLGSAALNLLGSIAWRFILSITAPVIQRIHVKHPALSNLSGYAVAASLIASSTLAYCLVHVLLYLAGVVAGPLRVLRLGFVLQYTPMYAIVALFLVYRLREPLSRYPKVAPIVAIVVWAWNLMLSSTPERAKGDPIQLVPAKLRLEVPLIQEPSELPSHQSPNSRATYPATPTFAHAAASDLIPSSSNAPGSKVGHSPVLKPTIAIAPTSALKSTVIKSAKASVTSITIPDPNCAEQRKPL